MWKYGMRMLIILCVCAMKAPVHASCVLDSKEISARAPLFYAKQGEDDMVSWEIDQIKYAGKTADYARFLIELAKDSKVFMTDNECLFFQGIILYNLRRLMPQVSLENVDTSKWGLEEAPVMLRYWKPFTLTPLNVDDFFAQCFEKKSVEDCVAFFMPYAVKMLQNGGRLRKDFNAQLMTHLKVALQKFENNASANTHYLSLLYGMCVCYFSLLEDEQVKQLFFKNRIAFDQKNRTVFDQLESHFYDKNLVYVATSEPHVRFLMLFMIHGFKPYQADNVLRSLALSGVEPSVWFQSYHTLLILLAVQTEQDFEKVFGRKSLIFPMQELQLKDQLSTSMNGLLYRRDMWRVLFAEDTFRDVFNVGMLYKHCIVPAQFSKITLLKREYDLRFLEDASDDSSEEFEKPLVKSPILPVAKFLKLSHSGGITS